jgi:Tfp pilus assembly protein PilN
MRAVNLIPAEQRGGAAVGLGRSEGGAYAVLVLLGGLAVCALLYGLAHHQVASRRAQAASIAAQAQQAQSAASQLAPYTSFIALREQRMQAVSTLADSRFDWAHVFHEFGRVLPVEVSVSSLSGTVGSSSSTATASTSSAAAGSSSVTSATPPGSVPIFTLAGCATSQPAVALMLERLRLIDGVDEVTLQNSIKTGSYGGVSVGGGCPSDDPAFTAQVTFDPLPTPSATAALSKTIAESTAGGSTTATPATSGASAR